MAFVLTGLVGFVWLLLWLWLYHDVDQHPRLSSEEKEYITAGQAARASDTKLNWKEYFRYKEVWGIAISRFVSDGAFYFFIFWLPSYLVDTKGFDLFQIGLFSWIPFLAADIGSIAGGWSGSMLINRGMSLDKSRKVIMWIGAILVIPVIFCLYIQSAFWAIALISMALFFTQFKQSSLFTLPVDLFESKNAATVWGISGSAGSFGAMLFTPLIGWLIDNVSYSPVFVIVAFLHLLSVLIIVMFIPKIRNLQLDAAI